MKMRNYTQARHQLFYIVVLLAILFGVSSHQSISAQQPGSNLLSKILKSPDIPLEVNAPPDTPVTIEAFSKELSGLDFKNLTGGYSNAALLFSFPEVKVKNTTDKVITSFSVVLQLKNKGRFFFVNPSSLKLAPNDSYVIRPQYWASHLRQERIRAEGSKASSHQLDLDSPELWISARASDASVLVGNVLFGNGTEWSSLKK